VRGLRLPREKSTAPDSFRSRRPNVASGGDLHESAHGSLRDSPSARSQLPRRTPDLQPDDATQAKPVACRRVPSSRRAPAKVGRMKPQRGSKPRDTASSDWRPARAQIAPDAGFLPGRRRACWELRDALSAADRDAAKACAANGSVADSPKRAPRARPRWAHGPRAALRRARPTRSSRHPPASENEGSLGRPAAHAARNSSGSAWWRARSQSRCLRPFLAECGTIRRPSPHDSRLHDMLFREHERLTRHL